MTYSIETKATLEKFVTENWISVNKYLDSYSRDLKVPFTSSVDIRESTNKIAPVDNNIYPAGFNNLCALDADYSSEVIQKQIKARPHRRLSWELFPNQTLKTFSILITWER